MVRSIRISVSTYNSVIFSGGMVQIATMFSELDSSARGSFMGRLEAVLGLGWGVGAFAGAYLVSEEDYDSAAVL